MADAPDLISLCLWDLRSQFEAQLRHLTNVQRRYEQLKTAGSEQRAREKRQILADLTDIRRLNVSVRVVCEDTEAAVAELPE